MRISDWSSDVCSSDLEELLEILRNRVRMYEVMREEFEAVEAVAVTPRRTQIVAALDDIDDEDLIERQDMVVTVTMGGYIKRTPLDSFRAQKRGGKGRSGMATKDEDAVRELLRSEEHTSEIGRAHV